MASAVVMVIGTAGCGGEDQAQDVTELLARTAASTQGQAALNQAGVQVSGPLSCDSRQNGASVDVSCTGTSLDGKPVVLTGTVDSAPGGTAIRGAFTATAGGVEVLNTDCLGC
jgi:hypothetical protein